MSSTSAAVACSPAPLAAAGIVLEFVGPVALILGLGTRAAGLAMAVFMAVAGFTHVGNGFFMNWFGAQPAGVEGFEFHLLARCDGAGPRGTRRRRVVAGPSAGQALSDDLGKKGGGRHLSARPCFDPPAAPASSQ